MMSITVISLKEFDSAFGALGEKVGPRTGENRRTQDQKDWYVVRSFLKGAIAGRRFLLPLKIERGRPPEPDFVVEQQAARSFVEITEATSEADQREMTHQEVIGKPILVGQLGGRFEGGGGEPGHVWASDIVEAIERKERKSIFSTSLIDRHLIIYPNSNASFLIFNKDDERRAFSILLHVINTKHQKLSKIANGCFVHVLGKEHVFFDVLGRPICRQRLI